MRKLSLALSIALSLAAIAALHAQTAPAPAPASGDKVTVTGCLERAVRNPPLDTGNAVGTSGASTTGTTDEPIIRSDTKWVLTAPSRRMSGETVGTSGERPRLEYRLDVPDESNIAAHEGHKVQITGTVEEGQAANAEKDGTQAHAGHRAPLLKIESVKMLSENCSR